MGKNIIRSPEKQYVGFLRGINVGAHHKVPMAYLRKELATLGLKNVETILNSGNLIFQFEKTYYEELQEKISAHLEKAFGFPIPVVIFNAESIQNIYSSQPFREVTFTRDIRLYVSFLKNTMDSDFEVPWISTDKSFRITGKTDRVIYSVLNISNSKTQAAMKVLEDFFGKNITTRNWNTIERIQKKIQIK